MKESKFIEQNKEKWEKLERMIQVENSDPNELSDLFIQLTDDLSYSRTFYQNRTVRAYLNNLTRKIFEKIYINKKAKRKNILNFWKEELPSIVYQSRYELLISLIVFLLAMAIGVFSSVIDPDFSKLILGDQYIEMTMENIESGDPMAVYKKMNQVDMFLGITWNNVLVAFRTFIFGIFLSLGTLLILIYNGIMLGTFQYFFVEKELFLESFLTIWIHGTLEISSIVIAGGAGIVFGKGLLFPGTLTRLQSFQESAVRALKIFIGTVPIFILAGLLESFVTRYTDVPDILRIAIILLSASFIIYYFIILPLRVKGDVKRSELPTSSAQKDFEGEKELIGQINNVSEILNFTFAFYHKNIKKFVWSTLLLSFVYPVIYFFYMHENLGYISHGFFSNIGLLFNYPDFPFLIILNSIAIATVFFSVSQLLFGEKQFLPLSSGKRITEFLSVFAITLIVNLVFFLEEAVLLGIIAFVILPYALNWMITALKSGKGFFGAFRYSFQLLNNVAGRLWGNYAATIILTFIAFVFFNSPVFMGASEVLQWNLPFEYETVSRILSSLRFWFITFLLFLLVPMVYLSIAINHYSLEEIHSAAGLKQKVEKFLV